MPPLTEKLALSQTCGTTSKGYDILWIITETKTTTNPDSTNPKQTLNVNPKTKYICLNLNHKGCRLDYFCLS